MLMSDFAFSPDSLTVPPNATVALALRNEGETRHNFSAVAVDVSQDVEAGASGRVTFQLPRSGKLAFFCKYHPGQMTGTVGIEGDPSDQGSTESSEQDY